MSVNDIINKELNLKINNKNKIKIISHEKLNIINKENTESFYTNEILIPKERLTLLYTDFFENKLTVLFQNLIKNIDPTILQNKSEKTYNDITNITTEFDQFNKKIHVIKKNLNFGNIFNDFVKTKESNILGKITDYVLKENPEYSLDEIFSISNDAVKSFDMEIFKDQETFNNVILKFFNYKFEEEEILINSDRIVGQILANLSVANNSFIYPNCFNSKNHLNSQVNIEDKSYENKNALPILNVSNFFNDSNIDNIDSVLNKDDFNINKFSFYNNSSTIQQNNRIGTRNYIFNKTMSQQNITSHFRNYYRINRGSFPKFFTQPSFNISNNNHLQNPGVFFVKRGLEYEDIFFIENGLHATTKNRPTLTQNFYKFYLGNPGSYFDNSRLPFNLPDINNFIISKKLNEKFVKWRENYPESIQIQQSEANNAYSSNNTYNIEGVNRLIIFSNNNGKEDNIQHAIEGEILSRNNTSDIQNSIFFNDDQNNNVSLLENRAFYNFDSINTNFITRSSLTAIEKTNLNNKFMDYYDNDLKNSDYYFNARYFKDLDLYKINNGMYGLKTLINDVIGYEYEEKEEELFENRSINLEDLNASFNLSEEDIFSTFNNFSSLSEYKYNISKYLCFNKKPINILSDFSKGIKKIIKNNNFGLLYSENEDYAIYNKESSPFLDKEVMKNNFINIESYNIKSSENFIFNNIDIGQIENVENVKDVLGIFKENFKNNTFKNRRTGFKEIINENINIIEDLNYTGNVEEKNKKFIFEKLLTKSFVSKNKTVKKELVKMILYSIFKSDFDILDTRNTNLEIIEAYNDISDLIDFNKINKNIFSLEKLKKIHSYTNFKINKESKIHTAIKSLLSKNFTVDTYVNSQLSHKKTSDLKFYNHKGQVLNILPDGIVKKVNFGDSLNSWFGLEYRNNFDIYINKSNSGIYDGEKINEDSFSPYYNMSILYFDPENSYWNDLIKFFDGTAGYNNLNNYSANPDYTTEYKRLIKEGITNKKSLFQSFPYIEKNVVFKNYYFELSRSDGKTASNYIKSFVTKILDASSVNYSKVIGEDNNKIKKFFEDNEKIINDISNLLEIYCTILDTSFNILTKLSCFDIIHNSIERYSLTKEKVPGIDTEYNKSSVLSNIKTLNKQAAVADLKKLLIILNKHEFNYEGLNTESFTPLFIDNQIQENIIQTRRFFNLQEISRSLIDSDILEAMSLDIYVSYLLNFEKNKNKLRIAKDSLDNIVNYISNTINSGNENLNKKILNNFGNKNYLNYLSREVNNILHYKEMYQSYLNASKSQPSENLYKDFKFEHRLEEIKNKLETSDISLQEIIDKTGNSLNLDIMRIGIPGEVYNNLTFNSLIKLEVIPFCHTLPDFIFKNITFYYSPVLTNIKPYEANVKNKVGAYIKNSENFIDRYKILNLEEAREILKDSLINNDRIDYEAQSYYIQNIGGEIQNNYLDLFFEKIVDDHYTSNNIKNISILDQKIFDEVLINNIKSSGAKTIDPKVFDLFNNMTDTKFYNIFGKNKGEILNINEMENGYYKGKLMWEVLEKNNISQAFIEELQKDITNIELFKNLKEPQYYDIFSVVINKDQLEPAGSEIISAERLNNDPNAVGNLLYENVLTEIKNNFTFVLKVEIL